MSPAIHGPVTTSKWTDAYTRANCSSCDWKTDRGSARLVLKDAQGHVSSNPGHLVAVDRGQTRYVKSAGAFAAALKAEVDGGNAMLDAREEG